MTESLKSSHETTCNICVLGGLAITKCSVCEHRMCRKCTNEWYLQNMTLRGFSSRTCPMCRTKNTYPNDVPETQGSLKRLFRILPEDLPYPERLQGPNSMWIQEPTPDRAVAALFEVMPLNVLEKLRNGRVG